MATKSSGDEDKNRFQLSTNRFLTVSVFKHQVRVDIREFYLTDDGQRKPGKKGISLSKKEWEALKDKMDDIEKAIKENDSDSD